MYLEYILFKWLQLCTIIAYLFYSRGGSAAGLDKGLSSPVGLKSPWCLDGSLSGQKNVADTILEVFIEIYYFQLN